MDSRRTIGICTFVVVMTSATWARAEAPPTSEAPSLGAPGQVALSLERLFGLDHLSEKIVMNGATVANASSTSISAFRQPRFGDYAAPRAAADVFVGSGVSVGAAFSVGYGTETYNSAALGAGVSTVESMTDIQLAPRVGYALRLEPWLSIWPRAGITYNRESGSVPDVGSGQVSTSNDALAATADVPLALTLVPRVLLTMAPTLDVTLWSRGPGAPLAAEQLKVVELGLLAGMTVLL